MKKIMFFAAAVAAMSLAACGNGSDKNAAEDSTLVDDTIVEVEEIAAEIVPGDSADTVTEVDMQVADTITAAPDDRPCAPRRLPQRQAAGASGDQRRPPARRGRRQVLHKRRRTAHGGVRRAGSACARARRHAPHRR